MERNASIPGSGLVMSDGGDVRCHSDVLCLIMVMSYPAERPAFQVSYKYSVLVNLPRFIRSCFPEAGVPKTERVAGGSSHLRVKSRLVTWSPAMCSLPD